MEKTRYILWGLLLVVLTACGSSLATTIGPSDDVIGVSGDPDTNYGKEPWGDERPYLYAGHNDSVKYAVIRSFMKFSGISVPAGQYVESATLYLWAGYEDASAQVNVAVGADDSWSEDTLTWNTQPAALQYGGSDVVIGSFTPTTQFGSVTGYTAISLDVSNPTLLSQLLSDEMITFILKLNDETTAFASEQFDSKAGGHAPYLEYTVVPEPTTLGLLAAGGLLGMFRKRK